MSGDAVYLPHFFEALHVTSIAASEAWARTILKEKTPHYCVVDIEVCNDKGQILIMKQ